MTRITITSFVFWVALIAGSTRSSAQVSADDFIPAVRGGPTDVKQADAVKIQGRKVSAPTAQDAVNAAIQKNKKDLDTGKPDVGANMVSFPSGMGVVATGAASYRVMENPTATRIAKRQAYVAAFTVAKKEMAQLLNGLDNDSKNTFRIALQNVETDKQSLTSISQNSEESLRQTVTMMLRGFAIYEVMDDVKTNTVYVSIVTTPKTRGQHARPAPNVVEASDLKQGLLQVIDEVQNGLCPPVGGRVIILKTTGETAFVGFGSSIIRDNANSAVQAKLNLDALKIARARSLDSLCGLIVSDENSWEGTSKETVQEEVKAFDQARQGDPTAQVDPTDVKRLATQRQKFVSTMQNTDVYMSARRGVLPPGIAQPKTWTSSDQGWMCAMAVYIPSMTNAAAQTADDIAKSSIIQPVRHGDANQPDANAASSDPNKQGFKDENNPNISHPGKDVGAGPIGKANKNDQ
jgi:hypothetical protein